MANYNDSLETMKKKYDEFIKRYEGLANNEPFSYTIFDNLKKIIESENKKLKNALNRIKPQEQSYTESLNSLTEEYSKKEKELELTLRTKVKEIVADHIDKCKVLREQIDAKKKAVKSEENDILMDIEFFFIGSEQNVDLFEREYNDNINRFAYQFGVAKESYSQNTILFNNTLERDLKELTENYEKILTDYDKNTDRIIEHYRKNENELNEIYNLKINEFNDILNENKNLKRKESMELNNKIRALASDRNDKILAARQEYAKKQAEAQGEKDSMRQEFQLENQKISREFISNMGKLDEKSSYTKEMYTANTDEEKRNLQYKLLEIKNEEEKELINLYSSNAKRRQIKNVKNQYYKYSNLERKNTEKTLKNLSNSYQIDVEKSHYQRMLLDLDRNYDIKSVLEHESYNNKIFQENNNEYETDMNLQVDIHNLEYNNAAAKIRTENTLKILKDEKEFDEVEALHSIEIEKLLCQIKSINFEIESFEEIRKLLHKFEDEKYKLTYNFKTVNNVLEIEKCKVLDTLNRSIYNLKTKSSKMVFDTSKESTALKNKEYEQNNKAKINKIKLNLKNEEKLFSYNIECLKREESYEIDVLNRNYYYELDSLGHTFLSDKFVLEFKKFMQHLSLLSELVRTTILLCAKSLELVFKNITVRPEYLELIRSFVKEFTSLAFEEIQRFVGDFHSVADGMINDRLDFEETLKYKGFYKNIELQYKEATDALNDKKNEIIRQIDAINIIVDDEKNQINIIDNELFMKRKKMKSDAIPYRIFREEIIKLQNDRHQVEIESLKNSKRIITLTKELNRLDAQINKINISYTRQQDEIKKMQLTNAQSYFELRKSLSRHINIYSSNVVSKLRIPDSQEFEFTDYSSIVKQRCELNIGITQKFLIDTHEIFNTFGRDERAAIIKSADILDNGYMTDLSELENDAKDEALDAKNAFQRDEEIRFEEMQKFDRDVINMQASMKQEMINHENLIKKYTQDIQNEMNEANRTFYNDFYSICANQQDIINVQENNMNRLSTEYETNRTTVYDRFKKSKEQLKVSLSEYIASQNEVLNHLPTAVKEQEKSINDEASQREADMEQSYIDIKAKNASAKKEIKKNKLLIEQAFIVKQEEMDKEHKVNRYKEKKQHINNMKRIPQ